jgi:hypothetical protein
MLAWYGCKVTLGKPNTSSKLSTELVDNSVRIFGNDGKWVLRGKCLKIEHPKHFFIILK